MIKTHIRQQHKETCNKYDKIQKKENMFYIGTQLTKAKKLTMTNLNFNFMNKNVFLSQHCQENKLIV